MWHEILNFFHETQNWLLVGLVLLVGYGAGKLAKLARLPSVIGYLVTGVVLGGSLMDVIDLHTSEQLGLITDFGLAIVAFMIGTELSRKILQRIGKELVSTLLFEAFGAVILTFAACVLLAGMILPDGMKVMPVALIFGALAAATAPAGTVAVIQEYRARGPITKMLLAIVGLDDGLAIMTYAFTVAAAKMLLGGKLSFGGVVTGPIVEIVGALVLGTVGGMFLTAIISRVKSRGELLVITLGTVFLVTGLANIMHLSLILANLAVGTTLTNISSRETERSYGVVEQISLPVYILFFVVAGAHLDLRVLAATGLMVPVYIVGRSAGKISGAYAGTTIGGSNATMRKNLGLGLLSQAGVAVGLSLMVSRDLAEFGEAGRAIGLVVINTIAATTIFFEIVGPIFTKIALDKGGEINAANPTGET
ncbi:MAG: cation:proton antiporter [Planctomycetes bacterium]|nr:cation:proton antiporter [Planctomycetota bacterium]